MSLPILPKQQVYFEDRSFTRDVLDKSLRILERSPENKDGLLTVKDGDEGFYALLRGGEIVRAGQFSDGRAFDLGVSVFLHILTRAEQAKFALYGLEPMLFDCLALLFSRHPAMYGVARYLALPDLARTLRREAQDVVLAFGVPGEINLAFFRRGVPYRLFMTDHLAPASKGTILDQIDMYLLRSEKSRRSQDVIVSLYDQVSEAVPVLYAPAVTDPVEAEKGQPADMFLSVAFRGRTIKRVALDKPVLTIGRVKECDVVIDNLGVSRVHCAISRTPKGLLLEDRGSLNGLVVNDQVKKTAYLKDGDVILVGKHKLIVGGKDLAPAKAQADERTLQAYDATMVLDSRVRPDLFVDVRRKKTALPMSSLEMPSTRARESEPRTEAQDFARASGAVIEARANGRGTIPEPTPAVEPSAIEREVPPEPEIEATMDPSQPSSGKPRLVFDRSTAFEMVAPIVTIGSGDDVDLKLEGFRVGKTAAKIVRDGTGRFRLVNLSRLHRPRINGTAVSSEEILLDGDEVRVGKKSFVFSLS